MRFEKNLKNDLIESHKWDWVLKITSEKDYYVLNCSSMPFSSNSKPFKMFISKSDLKDNEIEFIDCKL